MKAVAMTKMGVCAFLYATSCQLALANTWCVNPGGTSGCLSTIGAAIDASAAGDTITIGHGVYKELILITKPLVLIGEGPDNTTIDATGKANGFKISNTNQVVVAGFTVQNAETAGIWITGSSFVTIVGNIVLSNDKALITGVTSSCPALAGTVFEQNEPTDCGEGIFLSGVDHSVVARNTLMWNAGGILLTDDTGPSHDNQIIGNTVLHNSPDCGITLPSHNAVSGGVVHNLVADNDSRFNGAAGVGIFAPRPGTRSSGNIVKNNHLVGNGHAGVAMHNHVPVGAPGLPMTPASLDDNQIIGNTISDNGAEVGDTATSGPTGIHLASKTPVSGTVIDGNVIEHEALDISINIPVGIAGPPAVQIQLNDLSGNPHVVGLENINATAINASVNWWGCAQGPGAPGCTTVSGTSIQTGPALPSPIPASSSSKRRDAGAGHE